ncbi:MAG: hypothetical protein JW947_10435, partial [Sedimentisphaerales bacterium]|nr:hypothetical protein [Sedimentisphaerales bacterium]
PANPNKRLNLVKIICRRNTQYALRNTARSFSAQKGNFNHFQTKLCQTKPNLKMQEMNLTNYMTTRYSNILQLGPTQKQTQTKPKFTRRSEPVLCSVSEEGCVGGQSQMLRKLRILTHLLYHNIMLQRFYSPQAG